MTYQTNLETVFANISNAINEIHLNPMFYSNNIYDFYRSDNQQHLATLLSQNMEIIQLFVTHCCHKTLKGHPYHIYLLRVNMIHNHKVSNVNYRLILSKNPTCPIRHPHRILCRSRLTQST